MLHNVTLHVFFQFLPLFRVLILCSSSPPNWFVQVSFSLPLPSLVENKESRFGCMPQLGSSTTDAILRPEEGDGEI